MKIIIKFIIILFIAEFTLGTYRGRIYYRKPTKFFYNDDLDVAASNHKKNDDKNIEKGGEKNYNTGHHNSDHDEGEKVKFY